MSFSTARRLSLRSRLESLYGKQADKTLARLDALCDEYRGRLKSRGESRALWSERDVVLIAYADTVSQQGDTPLAGLNRFLHDWRLADAFSTVHLLPFFPSSSDDGFSVIDYRAVDPAFGGWGDVAALGESFDLMFDLVLNHCSQHSRWFQGYLQGEEPYSRYFIDANPAEPALDRVTRPRSLPLLTKFDTTRGERHVWTTFSADQIDLNFAEPGVLLEICDVLLSYVERGARIIRFDAIAYLWKRLGTDCIHLPETHLVVKLFRELLDDLAPGTLLITETNVPHKENVSYFGGGDEAHLVYQFSLAPLLLDAFLTGDPSPLNDWLRGLEPTGSGMTYFNFTASHDGIGVRPLEGLVSTERLDRLVTAVLARGGQVSTRRTADGTDSPYELNITYFDALGRTGDEAASHGRRFLASQAIMLALRGVPGVYFHSLVGTPNWQDGVAATGRARTINRRKFQRTELDALLADAANPQGAVFDGYRKMLAVRIAQPAFHPEANQEVPHISTPGLVAFLRTSLDASQRVIVLSNVTSQPIKVDDAVIAGFTGGTDLLTGEAFDATPTIDARRTVWLDVS